MAVLRPLGQRACDGRLDCGRDLRIEGAQRRWILARMGMHKLDEPTGEGQASAQQ